MKCDYRDEKCVRVGHDCAYCNVVDMHLCDTCKKTYPECDGKNVKFGCDIDTYPNTRQNKDNIFYCDGYVKREKKKTNADRIVKQGGVSDDTDNVCEWRLCDEEANVYDTSCRNPHILIEGTPQENNYEFCPYCGKKIKTVGD